jgi:aspartyl-tRNA(Asn)/glutamyl-tRNA(Gln) amidotransferase subunit A
MDPAAKSLQPWALTLVEGLSEMRAGVLGARAWVDALFDRITRLEPRIRAWSHLDREGAVAAADRVDRASQRTASLPIAGMPLGIKDVIAVGGLPFEAGSPLFAGRIAETDATLVSRLRAAGAVVLGKTVTCELATNQPSQTCNPWDPERTPGASSAGSAAAVAAAMVPAAVGTQTGGSIIRPAAYCGVLGFKPSTGIIPLDGVSPLSWSYDHVGFFSRAVADLALLLVAGSGGDIAALIARLDRKSIVAARKPRRVGYFRTDSDGHAEPEISARIAEAAEQVADSGIVVDEISLPMSFYELQAVDRLIIRAESASLYADRYQREPEKFGPDIRNNITSGLLVPAAHYLKAQRLRARFSDQLTALFATYDVIILPATRDLAPNRDMAGDPIFNTPFSGAGVPVVTLPLQRTRGALPVGVQLVGRGGRDMALLGHAAWLERHMGWRASIAPVPEEGKVQ